MKVLVINAGSSSIKYGLFDTEQNYRLLKKGVAERIGEKRSAIKHFVNQQKEEIEIHLPDHRAAMHALFDHIDKGEIKGVGHRIVHGGDQLWNPTLIDEQIIEQIKEAGRFVPLHVAPNLIGIEVSQEMLPSTPQVASFDTAPFATLDSKAFLYGIPIEYYEKHKIRKYGFHGINHSYVAGEATRLLGREKLKIITCHLGNGCSISAFDSGTSIDTSMGLTPLEGLVMGSRCGDIDPSAILYLIDVLGLQTKQVTDLLNKKSGLLGLCGKNDMRDICALSEKGDKWAHIAIEIFVYRVQKYIGAYIAALSGVDAIVFTAGIGENDPYIRERVAANFGYVGAFVDKEKNQRQAPIFSTANSKVFLINIAANEELVIAKQTDQLIKLKASAKGGLRDF
jgi:acetate kinase